MISCIVAAVIRPMQMKDTNGDVDVTCVACEVQIAQHTKALPTYFLTEMIAGTMRITIIKKSAVQCSAVQLETA
jgi:hypothetical protein